MKVSASQIETSILCIRKWWFLYQLRMPSPPNDSFAKGSVLHGCCERFLLGKDPFPAGWTKDPDTQKEIDPIYAQLIQVLVKEAIATGYLEPRPGSRVEQWFEIQVDEDTVLVGKKDHEIRPARIEDHKSSGSSRYLKGPILLKKNLQMLIYAFELLLQVRQAGQVMPGHVELVHNQFVLPKVESGGEFREPPRVQQRIAEVTPKEVEQFWDAVVMPAIATMKQATAVTDAWLLPDPPAKACNSFGGCQFMPLCTGQETPLTYAKRIGNMSGQKPRINMAKALDEFLKSRRQATVPPAGEPVINPPQETAPEPAPTPPTGDAPPPWWAKICGRCQAQGKAPGFNLKKKSICMICKNVTKVDISDYEYSITDDGAVQWWKKGAEKPVAEMPAPVTEDKGTKTLYTNEDLFEELRRAATIDDVIPLYERMVEVFGEEDSKGKEVFEEAMEKRLAELAEAPNEPEVVEEPKPEPKKRAKKEPKPEAPKKLEGPSVETIMIDEPAKGFTLAICCALSKTGGQTTILIEDILNKIEGYWTQDVWKRREELLKTVSEDPSMMGLLDGVLVLHNTRTPDGDNLAAALKPHARMVIHGF